MMATDIERLLAFDRQHLWHPYASMTQPPPANLVASALGTRIRLQDGTELIDAVSSWWCMVHGHNPPAVIAAIQEQAAQFAQVMFAGFTHRPAIELAEALLAVCPPSLNRVFYADTGSIAVECALKMAAQYQVAKGRPKRCRMATIRGGYHGDTTGAMAVSEPAGMHEIFHGIMVQHLFAPQPHCEFDQPWRDDDFAPMAELLRKHRDELAAVIVEPIFQGGNAMRFYHPEYLRQLRELCSELDILLILDEIATGFGRTGNFCSGARGDCTGHHVRQQGPDWRHHRVKRGVVQRRGRRRHFFGHAWSVHARPDLHGQSVGLRGGLRGAAAVQELRLGGERARHGRAVAA